MFTEFAGVAVIIATVLEPRKVKRSSKTCAVCAVCGALNGGLIKALFGYDKGDRLTQSQISFLSLLL